MAGLFRKEVESVVSSKLSQITHTVQGYIPKGEINALNWSANKLRIPNPNTGAHPSAQGGFIEYVDIPLPKNGLGIINAIAALFQNGDRACVVGFKGGNLSFPIILHMLSVLHKETDQQYENTKDRSNVAGDKPNTGSTGVNFSAGSTPPPPIEHSGLSPTPQAQSFSGVKTSYESSKLAAAPVMEHIFKDRYTITAEKRV